MHNLNSNLLSVADRILEKRPHGFHKRAESAPVVCRENLSETVPLSLSDSALPFLQTNSERLGIHVVYVCDQANAETAIANLFQNQGLLGLDIETYGRSEFAEDKRAGLDPRKSSIRLIQIYDGMQTVYVFDCLKLGGIQSLRGSQLWQDKPMVAHNALFELKHLLFNGITVKKIGCTLLADRVLNGNRSRLKPELKLSASASLKDLAKEFLEIGISKEEQTSDWSSPELSPAQIEYAALDAVLPVKIFEKQHGLLESGGLEKAYKILRDAQTAVASMELVGIGFDVARHRSRIEDWKKEAAVLHAEIIQAVGKDVNLSSSKQVGAWLNDALKQEDLSAWIKTAGGKLSTSTPTFKLKENLHSIFPKIVEYRGVAKKLSSFGEGLYKFIDVLNNRLYGSFSLGTTSTGRMASQNPNMQNMPRAEFRDLFVARPGCVLIGLDYSQQELRVASLVTGDEELLAIYKAGGDIHANTAAAILGIPKESVTKSQRQLAKAVIFGLLYGQGAAGLARYAKQQYGVEMTEAEAETHRTNLFKTYRGLRTWQRSTGNLVKITGKIRTISGRLRDFGRESLGYQYTAALNLPIQGTAAEITLQAMTRLTPMLSDEFRLVNVIHDEILLEVIESRAQEVADKAKEAMEAAFLDIFPSAAPYLKNLVEAKSGKNWEETK